MHRADLKGVNLFFFVRVILGLWFRSSTHSARLSHMVGSGFSDPRFMSIKRRWRQTPSCAASHAATYSDLVVKRGRPMTGGGYSSRQVLHKEEKETSRWTARGDVSSAVRVCETLKSICFWRKTNAVVLGSTKIKQNLLYCLQVIRLLILVKLRELPYSKINDGPNH